MLIQELTCGKIFPQMPVYENNDKIWENFPKKGLFLIKFSHNSEKIIRANLPSPGKIKDYPVYCITTVSELETWFWFSSIPLTVISAQYPDGSVKSLALVPVIVVQGGI